MEKRSSYRARQPRRAVTHDEQWYSGTEFAQYFQGLSKQTPEDRERILDQERRVVRGFSRVVVALRPDLKDTPMGMPLTMLLFGMINWMFTWLKPDGRLGYDQMAPIVADLFFGGIHRIQIPPHEETPR